MQRWLPCLVAVVVTVVVFYWTQELWRSHIGVPYTYQLDALPHSLAIDQVIHGNWFWHDGRLGAPYGQNFVDWPLPENLHLVIAAFLGLFTDNWAAVLNGIYLISFPIVTVSAWWVLRRIGVSPWTAAVLAVLYSLLPYHMKRGQGHLFLALYYTVPLGVYLAWSIANAESLFPRNERLAARSRWFSRISWGSFRTVVFCILVGSSGVYYTAFTLIFVAVAAVIVLTVAGNWRAVIPAVAVTGLLVATVFVNLAPTIVYHRVHGENYQTAARSPAEAEIYGLKLAQMVLPNTGHRIPAFEKVASEYYAAFPVISEGPSPPLGIIGSVGLLTLFALLLVSPFVPATDDDRRERRLAVFAVAGYVVATIGGFATLIALFLTPMIRSWNRMSIFLGFLALAAVGLTVDRLLRIHAGRSERSRGRTALIPVALSLLLVVGIFDQTTPKGVPPYEAVQATFFSDQKFFRRIEATMPKAAMIFESPRWVFPEGSALENVGGYDLLQPYLNTDHLRWSFGGIKGRIESQWQDRLDLDDPAKLLPELVAVGFDGVYVDRRYGNRESQLLERDISSITGAQALLNEEGNKAFYDIRPYAENLRATSGPALEAARHSMLYPIFLEPSGEFYGTETDGQTKWLWADGDDADLHIYDTTKAKERSKISFGIRTMSEKPSNVRIKWPDGMVQNLQASSVPVTVEHFLETPQGWTDVEIDTDAPRVPPQVDERPLHFRLDNLTLDPA